MVNKILKNESFQPNTQESLAGSRNSLALMEQLNYQYSFTREFLENPQDFCLLITNEGIFKLQY